MPKLEKRIWQGIAGVSSILAVAGWIAYGSANKIPNVSEVQENYVAPNRLEVKTLDINKNGKPETVIRIDRNKYWLVQEINGHPEFMGFRPWPWDIERGWSDEQIKDFIRSNVPSYFSEEDIEKMIKKEIAEEKK